MMFACLHQIMQTGDNQKTVMLSARIPAEFHRMMKILCVQRGISIQEFVYQSLKENYIKQSKRK